MSANENNLLTCYNRGCGQKYDPENNNDDSCRFHPGVPFFHDGYKSWTCCNKKFRDFTEFLNTSGCTTDKHSNVKPPEPPKSESTDVEIPDPLPEVKPMVQEVERPSYDTPMVTLKPILTPSIQQQIAASQNAKATTKEDPEDTLLRMGTPCQNSGCNVIYEGPSTDSTICVHHPGGPVFHEGLKFWSCCQKRTSDFQTFLNQEGCTKGSHVWYKKEKTENIECRWDWHQTGNDVVISIYGKEYCTTKSIVQINPVRVYVDLVFPKENDGVFNLDIETRGVIDVANCQVTMFGTKVEIKLKKAQLIKWEKLDIPRKVEKDVKEKQNQKEKVEIITPQVDAIDLDDVELAY